MADGVVQVQPDSTGKIVDTSSLTVGANTVQRQRVIWADPTNAAGLTAVVNSAPAGTEYAPVTRPVLLSDTSSGTTAPSKFLTVGGKTNDGTPQYQILPLGAAGRSVIVEGFSGGTGIPVTGTFWQATQPVSGTFWQATQPVSGTVTANAGSGTFTTSDGNAASQGSTTSGQKGFLELGAVTTAAPTYTTGQSSPLSLTTGGLLRVDGSGVTQPVSGTVTTTPPSNASSNVAQINGVTPLMGNGATGTGSQRVTIASDNTAFAVNSTLSAETTKVVGTVRMLGNVGAILDGATGAAVPANVIFNGARAATANPTNATGGNLVGVMADKAGRIVTTHGNVRELVGIQTTSVATVSETTIVTAGAAGVFNDISQLIITTAGAAAQTITIKDATAGTTRMVFNYPNATLAPGAPLIINFNPPVPQATAAANWTTTNSAATAVNFTVVFVKNT